MKFIAALMLCLAPLASAASARDQTVRSSCIGDRCVWYGRGGVRLGTTTADGTGRYIVRNATGKRLGTVQPTRQGVRVTQDWRK